MKLGVKRHSHADRGVDLYETPAPATRALMRVEDLPRRLWDPCAGKGAMSRVLRAGRHKVYATDLVAHRKRDPDIIPRVNFLTTWTPPDGVEAIVMNPPYKLADAFVRHALTLVPRVYALQRLMALEGVGRSDLIDGHLRKVWVGKERLEMIHRVGWTGPRVTGSGMALAWFVYTARKRPAGSDFRINRMSWRKED